MVANKLKIPGGAFQVARKLFESELWLQKTPSWIVIWIYIIGKVRHESNKQFQRGEDYFNFAKEHKEIGKYISLDQIKKVKINHKKDE